MNNLPEILTLDGNETTTHIHTPDVMLMEKVKEVLTENNYEFVSTLTDLIIFEDINIVEDLLSDSSSDTITEGVAKRTQVVRKGKRKILFKCKPGEKKIGRRCAKRNVGELNRMKRRAKRSARKSKSKRSRANKRRKMSMKRRIKKPKKHIIGSKPKLTKIKMPKSNLVLKH